MKKQIIKYISIFLILIIFLLPYKCIYAEETPEYVYNYYRINLKSLLGPSFSGINTTYNLNNNATIGIKNYFTIHEIIDNGVRFQGYCLHAGKDIFGPSEMGKHENFDDLKNSGNKSINGDQMELLQNIIAVGYQGQVRGTLIDKNSVPNSDNPYSCIDNEECEKAIVTQILIWETMEGNRTGYGVDDVKYDEDKGTIPFIKNNSGLSEKYKKILNEAKKLKEGAPDANFNETTYVLHWIPSQNKGSDPDAGEYAYSNWSDRNNNYTKSSINIGQYTYTPSESTSNNITITKDKKQNITITYSGKDRIKKQQIDFKWAIGSTKTSFEWYNFEYRLNKNLTRKSEIKERYQDILKGQMGVEASAKLYVRTESALLHIRKYDLDGNRRIAGATFNIYYCGYSQNYCGKAKKPVATINTTTKDDNVRIDKSGYYMFEEYVTPDGYEKMPNVYAKLKIEPSEADPTKDVVRVIDVTKDSPYIKIGNTADKFPGYIDLYNRERTYTIKKIDGNTGDPVNGATFQIKNSKDNTIRFNKKSDGNFIYDKNGKLDSLYEEKMSVYTFSGLPTGNYKLVETNVPQPYSMASKIEDRTKYFKVKKDYSMCETDNKYNCIGQDITEFTYKNYTTCVTIQKSGNNGDLLPGVVFELYDKSQTNRILLTKTKDDVYTYTTDKNAPPIELETNSKGKFTINNLPTGTSTGTSTETYYLKEIKAPIGYEITEENEWTKIDVKMDDAGSCINISISNAKGTFNFYKIDEDGNYLSAGIFKLQSYNEDSGKYEDQSLTYDEENDTYSIDEKGDSDIYTFTPNNGIVTFVNVSKTGKYRIVEIEAPEGFVLPNTNDAYVEFVVNASGYVSGDLTMINKKIVTGEGAQAQAELVINIQTGQDRIHYILIISVLAICIIGLIFLSKKINKK